MMGHRVRIAIGAAVLAGLAGTVRAQDPGGPPPPPPGPMRGGMAQMLQARFVEMDANHDGVVTRAEYDAYRAQRRARIEARMGDGRGPGPGPGGGPGMRRGGDLFDRADLNHDGRVTMAEAQAAAQAMMGGRGMRGPGGGPRGGEETGPGYGAPTDGGAPGYDTGAAPPPPRG